MNALEYAASDTKYQTAIELQEHALFALLKPSLKRDENKWCVLFGDNIQEGVCGFGDSPNIAVQAFNEEWYKKIEDSKKETPELINGVNEQLKNLKI